MPIPQGKFVGFQAQGLWPTMLGVALNRNSFLKAWQVGSVTFTSAAVGAISITEQAVTITGLTPNDLVAVMANTAPTANVGNLGTGRVTAANTLQLRYINPTAGSLTPPASSVYFFMAFQVQ
jgi:hypothetical protein